jgi:hypothetical protein
MALMAELLPGADPGAAMGAKGPVILRQPQAGPARPAEKGVFLNRLLAVGTLRHLNPKIIKIAVIFNISFYFFNFKVGGQGAGVELGSHGEPPDVPFTTTVFKGTIIPSKK